MHSRICFVSHRRRCISRRRPVSVASSMVIPCIHYVECMDRRRRRRFTTEATYFVASLITVRYPPQSATDPRIQEHKVAIGDLTVRRGMHSFRVSRSVVGNQPDLRMHLGTIRNFQPARRVALFAFKNLQCKLTAGDTPNALIQTPALDSSGESATVGTPQGPPRTSRAYAVKEHLVGPGDSFA